MTISSQTAEPRPIEAVLRDLLAVEDSGTGNKALRERLLRLEKKVVAGQLHLAVLGQMKRGKSSFINAILGDEILPTGVSQVLKVL